MASAALARVDKSQVTELKSLPVPPPLVKMTMEAVNTILGEGTDWHVVQKVLSDPSFLDRLKGVSSDNVSTAVLDKLQKCIDNADYTPDNVGRQSKAAKSLCAWTHAFYNEAKA
ncbi:unnamed protein product [Vitrella brassicaformis CCMP3155]|uniref:Dynein heavy chain coiled coil stalk domain-containing protein n=1 Tax=Vitrella brassicaformis (strain CCMP3155) TaxID=1169540 RepID=A0A0G4FCQ4_VITBC|nr:unnamed protein product [Vitrella brassicaformis CCMP3155]|eukprot:CEM10939.1 unnamed protein product [Vitrella brassicaformis CCMP3155]